MIRLEPVRRGAGTALATALAQLHSACFPDDPWSVQAIAEIVEMIGVFGRIAFADEPAGDAAAVGLALAQSLGEDCEILALGVILARRRAGVGRALLAATTAEARCRGGRTLFLEVAEDNKPARALYAAHGFVQIGRRANYYRRPSGRIDALVLRLLLAT
jgi:[ribosomal protein S18]-alanine N-acetyltransferase